MKKLGIVLVVEPHEPGSLRHLVELSESADVIRTASSFAEGFTALHERPADAVVVDLSLSDAEGLAGLRAFREMIGRAPLVVVVDDPALAELAVLNGGADDSLERGSVNAASLGRAIRYSEHRRKTDVELAAAESRNHRLADIIEAADDLVLLIDSSERVFFMNRSAYRFFGEPELTEVPSLRAAVVLEAADRKGFWHGVLPDLLLDGYWRGDVRLVNIHGVSVRHTVTVMHHEKSDDDDQAYFSVVCHDLSALEAAAEKAHMERLIKAKDQFVATVSHELRTPLTAVLGFAEMLYAGAFDGDDEGGTEATKMIFSQAREVSDIIEDLMIGARADMGTVSIRLSDLDLAAEVLSVADPLRTGIDKELLIEIGDVSVTADPLRTRQIVRNLLTNAVRYGGDKVRVDAESTDRVVTLTVRDNGPGVPGDRRAEIFEPFQSTGRTSSPAAMGIGLTVSRQLAQLMGGELSYDYVDGWSEFCLKLPAAGVVG